MPRASRARIECFGPVRLALFALVVATGAVVLGTGCEQRAPNTQPAPILIENVNVLPMDSDQVLEEQAVVVENGIITTVGSLAAITIPAGSMTIDGRGKYLIPGLVDLHVHFH